jgi:hypothetical protein
VGGVISPYSKAGDALLAAEQDATGTAARVPYHPDFWTEHALREVYHSTGDVVEVKPKSLLKFGSYANLGMSFETVQAQGGNEVYVTTNAIDTVSSSNAGDTVFVVMEGHTIDGNGDFTFVVQSATLDGQNKVLLATPLARCSRIHNANGTAFVGDVYVYEDDTLTGGVPDTASKIHALALAIDQQTEKASTTISKNDYWFITQAWASVNKKKDAQVDFKLQVRLKGSVFRTYSDLTLGNSSGGQIFEFRPFFVVPQNADVRLVAAASSAGVSVSGGINGILATVKVDN